MAPSVQHWLEHLLKMVSYLHKRRLKGKVCVEPPSFEQQISKHGSKILHRNSPTIASAVVITDRKSLLKYAPNQRSDKSLLQVLNHMLCSKIYDTR